jgi:hypothetical protein
MIRPAGDSVRLPFYDFQYAENKLKPEKTYQDMNWGMM